MHASEPPAGRAQTRRRQRILLAGLFLAVTLHAFHAMAVVVIVPMLAAELDGRPLYGAVFSAYLLASLLGLVTAGRRVDRYGPRRSLGEGLALVAIGLVGSACARTIVFLVMARAVEGLGGGALMAVVTATVNREYNAAARPRVLAWMSAAWVLPGLLAPPLAGWIADLVGWRWVFLGVLPFVGLAAALTLPVLRARAHAEIARHGGGVRLGPAIELVSSVCVMLGALGGFSGGLLVVTFAVGAGLGVHAFGRIVPAGARRPMVTTRLLLTFVFFGADAFLPLALTDVRDMATSVAGGLMTVGAVCWSLGAFCHARLAAGVASSRVVTAGVAAIAAGVGGEILALDQATPLWLAFASWAVAGVGMGLAYNETAVTVMAATPRGREGETSSALGVADALGYALATGIGGALLAWGERGARSTAWSLSLTWILLILVCVVAGLVARRTRLRHDPIAAVPDGAHRAQPAPTAVPRL